ncbi:sensor histidine kinase [Flavobacterium paronense]|uniref:Sensor histidine kinase n=1 Tax=Flavobacterium paronense TaxID=1392775 RepID=A0ABV5GD16_9FLAO|nr:sensor histidine kinase [Flavobacterium paronense]MDN3676170.1 sensor histidine kinase [Flavobacterium paronense]
MYTKNKIVFHLIICVTFLVIPFLLTPPHRAEFGSKIGDYLIVRKEATNLVLLAFFYINYYYIIPKFYFKKRYLVVIISLLFFLFLSLLPDIILNNFTTSKHNFTFLINSQITLFLFVAIYFITYSMRINHRLKEAQIEIKNSQLSFLKGQINPHFLFNTLNSIYALSVKKSEETPSAIVKLSGMMRYSITEIEREFVLLDKEILFVTNYIALQKIRLGNTCSILFESENKYPNDIIIPLIFIPFVENAFKFGMSSDENAEIRIEIKNTNGNLYFESNNKKLNRSPQETSTEIGITNTKKRLDLLYANKHQLDIIETEHNFTVILKINLR